MKKSLITGFLALAIFTSANRFEEYRDLVTHHPEALGPIGNWQEGEIELVLDLEEMARIEEATGRQVGIVAQDNYWIWLNDPVRYPSGRGAVYGRILWRHALDGAPGVTVLPYDPERNEVYLLCAFRHATRSWELELIGGLRERGETVEEAARREVMEESGLVLKELIPLGSIAPDPGKTTSVVPIVLAEVAALGEASPEESEAIAGWVALPIERVRRALWEGEIELEVGGRMRKVLVRNGFIAYALMQLETMKGSLELSP